MDLARVIGTVVATERDPAFQHLKFAVVQPLTEKLVPKGKPLVAIDALSRGAGDLVYIVRSGDAMFAHHVEELVPTDCAIGGLVDSMWINPDEEVES